MSTIRGVPNANLPTPGLDSTQAPRETTAAQGTAQPTDSTVRVSSSGAGPSVGELPPVAPPAVSLNETASAATSFAENLREVGTATGSTEQMLMAFLKLQILEGSRNSMMQDLVSLGRGTLRHQALGEQQNADENWARGAPARTQAQGHYEQAENHEEQGDAILRSAGLSESEVTRLVEESEAAGKGGTDVADRYRQAHAGERDVESKARAIEKATVHYQRADVAETRGDGFSAQDPGGGPSAWVMGAYATMMRRAGTEGMGTLLANEEAQQKLLNDLMAILSGQRPDARAREDAIRELERSRNEVADLTLEFIDKHASAAAGRLGPMRS